MNCWSCGTPNEPGAKFCNNCGAAQSRACESCGHENPSAANFCSNCGNALAHAGEAASAPAAAGPVAERRLVSVLFVDLVGSTALAADRDPEDTREMLSRYFDVARSIVERHGGTVEKFIGDAVMAVWGAPVAHEDDAERAVRAALQLVAAVGTLGDGDDRLQARGGVLTGEAAVTIGAQGQGMVAGDLVNTASRLQSVAEPGTVLVGEPTYRSASEAISFEPAGERVLKGKAEPVATWRAKAVVAMRRGDRRAATLEPPFVGRDDELRQIQDLFELTSRERKPRLISVIGQAGIGKSRLAWEFEKYLDGVVEQVFWHEGRSPAYGEGISYWALAEMVRRRAGIAEADEATAANEKLNALLEDFLPDATERRWVAPRLAGLLGLADLPTESREELFAAWRTFFERTAERAPSVLAFVDLHWADQGMLDFVEYLLAWAKESPLFVVVLARPDLLERRPTWGSQARSVTRINLDPLTDEQMTELIHGTLPGLESAAIAPIVQRAEGIPLYAVETARMLLETGAVVERDGRFVLAGDISHMPVAETLHALIAARLDATLPEDRSLLQDASVLGQSFTVESLTAVSGREPGRLAEQLDRLQRRQLLMQDTDPRSPERGQYRFLQSMVREVAYQTLAKADRRSRHLAAARYFETLDDEEIAEVLATHYLEAYRASKAGPEAEMLAAQARISLSAAADRAAALHSHRRAIGFLEQALEVTSDPMEQGGLHLRAAESGEYSSQLQSAADHASAAQDLFRREGDPVRVLVAATLLGRSQVNATRGEEAIATLRAAIDEAKPLGDVPEMAAALAELSRVLMLTEASAESVAVADRALEVAGRHDLVKPTVEALINRGSALSQLGRRYEAEAALRGAIVLADRHRLHSATVRALNNLGSLRFTDDLGELVRLAAEGLDLSKRYGHRFFVNHFAMVLARDSVMAGKWDDALTEIDAIEETETPSLFHTFGFATSRALLAALRGEREEAKRLLERASELARELNAPQPTGWAHLTAAEVALLGCDWPQAVAEARLGLELYETMSGCAAVIAHCAAAADLAEPVDIATAALGRWASIDELVDRWFVAAARAALAARAGHLDEARVGYRAALDGLQSASHLVEWALTCLDWGTLCADRDPEAQEALNAGIGFFAERGAEAEARAYMAAFEPVAEAGKRASGVSLPTGSH